MFGYPPLRAYGAVEAEAAASAQTQSPSRIEPLRFCLLGYYGVGDCSCDDNRHRPTRRVVDNSDVFGYRFSHPNGMVSEFDLPPARSTIPQRWYE
jgi:hypothetical protein